MFTFFQLGTLFFKIVGNCKICLEIRRTRLNNLWSSLVYFGLRIRVLVLLPEFVG